MIWHIQSGCANTTLCLQHSSESHKGNLDVIVPVSLAPELKTHLPPPALKQCDSYRCVHRVHPSPYRHCFRRTVPWVHQEIQPWYFSRGSDTTYGNGLSLSAVPIIKIFKTAELLCSINDSVHIVVWHCLRDKPSEQVRNFFFRHITEVFIYTPVH